MNRRLITLLVGALVGLILYCLFEVGQAYAAKTKPRCAVMNPVPPPEVRGIRYGLTLIGGSFSNRCLDPVFEMGVYACLEEFDYPSAEPRIVECHVNAERLVFDVPRTIHVTMTALCEYTTIPRWYRISGYAWARSLPTDGGITYRSIQYDSKSMRKIRTTGGSKGVLQYCHIPSDRVSWRNRG